MPSQLISYSKFATPGYGTSLPGSPSDGDEFVLVDSTSAATYSWRLRYNASRASNKWEFIGGTPAFAEVTTAESPGSTGAYVALATAGPSITIPVAGNYDVSIGFGVGNQDPGWMSYDIGGTGAVDADGCFSAPEGATSQATAARTRRKNGLTAVTLTAKYKGTVAAAQPFSNRWMRVVPVAIGG